jgi:hypothetical protein
VDSLAFPGATCTYGGAGNLRSISIRQPIVFAFDRTGSTDTEWVGWRYRIEYKDLGTAGGGYQDWSDMAVGAWTKVRATDRSNADWASMTYRLPDDAPAHLLYRVSLDLGWFAPSKSHSDGRAVHVVYEYTLKQGSSTDGTKGSCPGSVATPTTASVVTPASVSGMVGVHVLLDTLEYPGITCAYHYFDPRDDLKRITVRAPIVYARNRTSATDSQTVGWRFRIQSRSSSSSDPADWETVYVSSVVKVKATDRYNAQWNQRSFSPASGSGRSWRVLVDLSWFTPGGATEGKAKLRPANSQFTYNGETHVYPYGECAADLG